jgi:hypothetical protein
MRARALLALTALLAALAAAQPAAAQTSEPAPPTCENGSCQDPLFTVQYPATKPFTTSRGVLVHLPVQFYDTDGYELVGTADLGVLRRMTAGSGFQPIQAGAGRGVANIAVVNYEDSNLEPYREFVLNIPTNAEQLSVPAGNPFEMFGAVIDPQNVGVTEKLILNRQLPIDVGREYYHLDKDPNPQQMSATITTSTADIQALDPGGHPVLRAHIPIDDSPAAQADAAQRLGSTAAFQRSAQDITSRGGLIEFNYVFRDIVTGAVKKAHLVGRVTSDQGADVRQGAVLPGTTFTAYPGTDFGNKVRSLDLRPQFAIHLPSGRYVLDDGWAPAVEPPLP